ncbi:MAG: hypothetical protein ACTH9R_09780 [Lactococcus cremoris]
MGNQLENVQHYTLLKMSDDIVSINDIKEKILSRSHLEPLRAKIPKGMSIDEANYKYRWEKIYQEEEDKKFVQMAAPVFSVKAIARLEYGKRMKLRDISGNYLPKSIRTQTNSFPLQFVGYERKWYCIVFTNDTAHLKRIKKLIGKDYIIELPESYQIDSDFFLWLFYRNIKRSKQLSDKINLSNIISFTGTVVNDENRFKGVSDQASELMITRAFIANQHPLTSMAITLNLPDGVTEFYLSQILLKDESRIRVGKKTCIYPLLSSDGNEYTIPIYIYLYVIPEIVRLYKENKSVFDSKSEEFKKEIGIEVIKNMMVKNDITIKDLK